MKIKRVRLPAQIRSLQIIESSLGPLIDHFEKIELDFRWCKFAEPFPLLYLSARLNKLRHSGVDIKTILPERGGNQFLGYASHVGFFDLIGQEIGRRVGEAYGSSSYFPIMQWSIDDVRRQAGDRPVAEKIDELAASMAKVLMQADTGDVFDVVKFSIREIVRNSFEHSRGKNCTFLGQYWPTRGEAEIVSLDDGIGIAETLWDNEYINASNNLAAIKLSLFPGVTGVSRSERSSQDYYWGNSGFGLYLLSNLFGDFGEFRIISNNDCLTLSNGKQYHRKVPFDGTGVALRFPVDQLGAAAARFPYLIEKGEKLRSELLRDFPIQASTASKMLRNDFSRD
ncbi:hypothetical protein [Vannielia litorea]|uniref:hypothetical protein n=1 Tax=Vannielia litorea TaxID=1217970 RepID=UPI001C972E59|nr:hypothetical protein [Vannielia litorea]MBY6048602.1 hypothetical protein [Vannielia litorea]MBY6076016.1 hypothetical protein [Vannielia litorea]